MFPFRELEVYDSFFLDGRECDKVGDDRYVVIDELGEVERLETMKDPNTLVELIEKEEVDEYPPELFFTALIGLLESMEADGQKIIKIKEFKEQSKALLQFYLDNNDQNN